MALVSRDGKDAIEATRYDLTVWEENGQSTEIGVAAISPDGDGWIANPILYPGSSTFRSTNRSEVEATVRKWCEEMVLTGSYRG